MVKKYELEDIAELLLGMSETSNPVLYQYFRGLANGELIITDGIQEGAIDMYALPLRQMDEDPNIEKITIRLHSPGAQSSRVWQFAM